MQETKRDGLPHHGAAGRHGRAAPLTRNRHDFGKRFPLIVAAVMSLPARSCLTDGEAIVSDDSGLTVFDPIRSWRHDTAAMLFAFDLIELDGQDLRRLPIEDRKRALAGLVGAPKPGIAVNASGRHQPYGRRSHRLSYVRMGASSLPIRGA